MINRKTPLCPDCEHLGKPINVQAHDNLISVTYRCMECARVWLVSAPVVGDLFTNARNRPETYPRDRS